MNNPFTFFNTTPYRLRQYRLRHSSYYREIISEDLIYKQNYQTVMELPKIEKLVINSTSKLFIEDRKNITKTLFGLEMICGQRLGIITALKSIAGFKIREGQVIGCKATLRKHSLDGFLDKLVLVILPRLNTLTEKKKSISHHLSLGLTDLLLFPELEKSFSLFENLRGLDLSFVMCKKNCLESLLLLTALQVPVCRQ